MQKLRTARRLAVVLIALAACGGGGSGSATRDTIDPAVADQLNADATVLQASDLPGAFTSNSSSSSSSASANAHDAQAQTTDACIKNATGTDPNAVDANRTAKSSRTFLTGTGFSVLEVGGAVEVYRDSSGLSPQLVAFSQPGVINCLKRAFIDELTGRGARVGDLTVTPSKVDGFGDEQAGVIVTGPVTLENVDVVIGVEFDFTRVGRYALTVSVFSINGVPDHNLAVTAMKAMVGRVPV